MRARPQGLAVVLAFLAVASVAAARPAQPDVEANARLDEAPSEGSTPTVTIALTANRDVNATFEIHATGGATLDGSTTWRLDAPQGSREERRLQIDEPTGFWAVWLRAVDEPGRALDVDACCLRAWSGSARGHWATPTNLTLDLEPRIGPVEVTSTVEATPEDGETVELTYERLPSTETAEDATLATHIGWSVDEGNVSRFHSADTPTARLPLADGQTRRVTLRTTWLHTFPAPPEATSGSQTIGGPVEHRCVLVERTGADVTVQRLEACLIEDGPGGAGEAVSTLSAGLVSLILASLAWARRP